MNGTLRANGKGGFPRTDKQPLLVASTLKGQRGKGGGGLGPEETMIPTQDISPALTAHHKRDSGQDEAMVVSHDVAPPLMRNSGNGPIQNQEGVMVAATLSAGAHSEGVRPPGRRLEDDSNLVAGTLRSHMRPGSNDLGGIVVGDEPATFQLAPESGQGSDLVAKACDIAPALDSTTASKGTDRGVRAVSAAGVRRLVPVECERLMSWPDDWTAPKGLKAPDSKRYAACGDGVVANVAEFIGRRMLAVHMANQRTDG